jgi:hypothetical protein
LIFIIVNEILFPTLSQILPNVELLVDDNDEGEKNKQTNKNQPVPAIDIAFWNNVRLMFCENTRGLLIVGLVTFSNFDSSFSCELYSGMYNVAKLQITKQINKNQHDLTNMKNTNRHTKLRRRASDSNRRRRDV